MKLRVEWLTYLMLVMNTLITAPVPFIFLFGLPAPVDKEDLGAMGIVQEYSWNPLFSCAFGCVVPAMSATWFGLVCVPRRWRAISALLCAFGVVVVNIFIEDEFLATKFGAGMPTSGFVCHVVQALAFLSILLPGMETAGGVLRKRPVWAHLLWWLMAALNSALLVGFLALLLSEDRDGDGDGSAGQFPGWLINVKEHKMATLSFAWNYLSLLVATMGLSWYAPLPRKALPFGILSVAAIAVNRRMGFFPRHYDSVHWAIATVYALQLLIPDPVTVGKSNAKTE